MTTDDLICMVFLGENAIFMKLRSTASFYELKYGVAERLKVLEESFSLIYKSERHPNLNFLVENEDDLKCMLEHNRKIGCTEIHMQVAVNIECSTPGKNQKVSMLFWGKIVVIADGDASLSADYSCPPPGNASNSERIQTDFPSGKIVMRADDILNNTSSIPQWWHTALTEKGQQFETVTELRLALQYYSMAKKFEYEFVKNDPKHIRVCCRYKETYGCPWMLFAAPVKNDKRMEIKRFVNEHSCGQHSNLSGQSRASRKFIAAQLRPVLKARPEIHPIDVQKDFLTRFGLRLEYSKIWWGKERAQQDMYGDSYEAYDQFRCRFNVNMLPLCSNVLYLFTCPEVALLYRYEQMVKQMNPGSYICIDQNEGRFRRLFICYAACIQGFLNGCRPLLFLDGTFLKDRYNGMLLSTIASETKGYFHLRIVYVIKKMFIIGDGSYKACGPYCMKVENFRSKLKDLGLKAKDTQVFGNLLQTACYKYTIAEWNDYMKEIYEMAPVAYEIAPVAYEIAINYSPEHWANAFFPDIRYGHVTSNVAESFNSWIREARLLRILQMVEHIRKQLMTRMNNRRIMACKWTSYLCPKAEQIVRENMEKGRTLEIRQSREDIFEVQSHRTTHIDLENRTCTCRAWDVTRIPCLHACAVIIYMKRDVYQYCDWFMSVETFKKSYDEILYPIPDYEKRSVPKDEIQILLPITTKRRGRNRTRRINNRTIYKWPVKCSRCKVEGHNRATYNEPIRD
ncbi:uncharacterized protein LOC109847765 [Asparagus officinalis]|uniref:uncharacterized protein LOC109847765 n=1 Tax=Asparagus officinalis TaxID=4686 RepID=UPI00098E38C7|nr:uncharacterized protein LOC109847765 [Asparagus officinalis]